MKEKNEAPKCIGMIMDGNRRWAKENSLSSVEGHKFGYEKLKEVAEWVKEVGIRNLIVYAFSTENWNRSKEEVSCLVDLLKKVLSEQIDEFNEKKTKLIFAGDISRFSRDIQELIRSAEEKTKDNEENTLVICLSYGGRAEIMSAVNNLLKEGKSSINEEEFSRALWTKNIPDPDLIIRTGGEERLSGFLPWQSVYSELFFSKTYWPAFSKEEFLEVLKEFSSRERRRGK
jgi:undecaprenyl diphosphate synthase